MGLARGGSSGQRKMALEHAPRQAEVQAQLKLAQASLARDRGGGGRRTAPARARLHDRAQQWLVTLALLGMARSARLAILTYLRR